MRYAKSVEYMPPEAASPIYMQAGGWEYGLILMPDGWAAAFRRPMQNRWTVGIARFDSQGEALEDMWKAALIEARA